MNVGTIIVLVLLAAAVVFAARHLWKSRGGCAGCSGCSGCSGKDGCCGTDGEKTRVK